jgi:hypothetical protein
MPSYYSVLRFVPDPIAGESINIGIIVVRGTETHVRLLEDWSRVQKFAATGIKEIQRLTREIAEDPCGSLGIDPKSGPQQLNEKLASWTNSLQFSVLRAATEDPTTLDATLEGLFLIEPADRQVTPAQRRTQLISTAMAEVRTAFQRRFDRMPKKLVHRAHPVSGARTWHPVDVALANGELYAGAFALPFATRQSERQLHDTDATAFAVEDILGANPNVHLSVIVDAAEQHSQQYTRAVELFRDMNVETVQASELSQWAHRAVKFVPDSAVGT